MKVKILVLCVLFFQNSIAKEVKSCTEEEWAGSQREMNRCADIDYQIADAELNKVYKKVKEAYKDDKKFLKYLKNSQLAWIKLRDTNRDLEFLPGEFYGTASGLCTQKEFVIERIKYLKQWITPQEPHVCVGSKKFYKQ